MEQEIFVYDFEKQLSLGKLGEKVVLKHIRSKINTIDVSDLSETKKRQTIGIDAMQIYESSAGIFYASFFDIKTDFQVHRTGKIFVETNATEDKKGCMLTTKAEQFLYYDPILGKLYYVPIFPLRKRYKSKGISKKHYKVTYKTGDITHEGEGILLSIEELLEIIPMLEIEEIDTLKI